MPGILSNVIQSVQTNVRQLPSVKAINSLPRVASVRQRMRFGPARQETMKATAQAVPPAVRERIQPPMVRGATIAESTTDVMDCSTSPPTFNGKPMTPREAIAFCGHM